MEKQIQQIELTTVPTGQEYAFKLPNGETVGLYEYLVWLGNTMWEVKKSTAG